MWRKGGHCDPLVNHWSFNNGYLLCLLNTTGVFDILFLWHNSVAYDERRQLTL